MTENSFEPAACPEVYDGGPGDDLVTDEEFSSWVKRSQAHTDKVMAEWDMGAKDRRDGPDSWDPSVEFYEAVDLELEDDVVPVRPSRRVRRRRRTGQQTAVTLPEEFRDGGVVDLTNVQTFDDPYTTVVIGHQNAYAESQRQQALIRHIYESVAENEPALLDETTIALLNSTWGRSCSHQEMSLKVILERPGAGKGTAQVRCSQCDNLLVSAPVSKIDVGYDA